MEPWSAVDAHNVGVEDKNGALEAVLQIRILTFIHPGSPIRFATLPRGSIDQWSQICITLMKSWIQIRIEMKSGIRILIEVRRWIRTRIRIEVMWIRNP